MRVGDDSEGSNGKLERVASAVPSSGRRCGGMVSYDADGNFIQRFGCEVHLFDPGPICAWQQLFHDEREARAEASREAGGTR